MAKDLGHVRWLGGGSGAGKSTIAALLARRFDLHIYSTDNAISVHGGDPGPDAPLLTALIAMTMDQRWLQRDAQTMLETFPWFAGERFDRIVDDLRPLGQRPLATLAEGFRLLPRLVSPLIEYPWQAVWLIPTDDFRRSAFARRADDQQFWRRTSDPAAALERLVARDALFADEVAREAHGRNLKTITVDGTRSEEDVADEVAAWLRLPTPIAPES